MQRGRVNVVFLAKVPAVAYEPRAHSCKRAQDQQKRQLKHARPAACVFLEVAVCGPPQRERRRTVWGILLEKCVRMHTTCAQDLTRRLQWIFLAKIMVLLSPFQVTLDRRVFLTLGRHCVRSMGTRCGYHSRSLGGILQHLRGLENVTRSSIGVSVSSKRAGYRFWVSCPF